MSHNNLRTDKTCLNCGTTVEERYCPHCGQENLELHDSTWHLLIHYIQDLVHYDGKTWHTLRNLLRRPGFIAREYIEGKRRMNIEPIKFYVFSSTVFFILFFYFIHPPVPETEDPRISYTKRIYQLKKEKQHLVGSPDTIQVNLLIGNLLRKIDSINIINKDTLEENLQLDLGELNLPKPEKNNWLEEKLFERATERNKELAEKYQGDANASMKDFLGELAHKLPQLIFLSLPFFAFNLKVLYLGRRKLNYVEHFIFSVYQYAYLYFTGAAYLILSNIVESIHQTSLSDAFDYVTAAFWIYLFVYLLLAMKRFYKDRWRTLLPRYSILLFFTSLQIFILGVLVALITFLI